VVIAMKEDPLKNTPEALTSEDQARREFMIKAGRFAVLTPPTITALLATSMTSPAIASSGGVYRPGNGFGDQNHIHTAPPGQIKKSELNLNKSEGKKGKS